MAKLRKFMKGEMIANEGEKATKFFVLVDGKVGIFKNGVKISEFDKEGTILGEMSLILKKPRTASILAITNAELLEVEGEIEDIIKQYPDISRKIIYSLAERLAKLTEEFTN
ncbi:MAG: cyclic nucleotide-binding domain-containing protein [Melioribacter sp.]|nr:cyclic nucleotide-binding domain-containing protein [Melioribacter sp.]